MVAEVVSALFPVEGVSAAGAATSRCCESGSSCSAACDSWGEGRLPGAVWAVLGGALEGRSSRIRRRMILFASVILVLSLDVCGYDNALPVLSAAVTKICHPRIEMNAIVIGQGRAGKARSRCLGAIPEVSEVLSCSFRDSSKWHKALKQGADWVFVCTANADHLLPIEQALLTGHSVCVDYPLVNDSEHMDRLYQLADDQGVQLVCEHIGLLTSAHLHRRSMVEHSQQVDVSVHFQGGAYRWVEAELQAGRYGHLAIGRLLPLMDLLGEIQLISAELLSTEHSTLRLDMISERGSIKLEERRGASLTRSTNWLLKTTPEQQMMADLARSDIYLKSTQNVLAAQNLIPRSVIRAVHHLAETINKCV